MKKKTKMSSRPATVFFAIMPPFSCLFVHFFFCFFATKWVVCWQPTEQKKSKHQKMWLVENEMGFRQSVVPRNYGVGWWKASTIYCIVCAELCNCFFTEKKTLVFFILFEACNDNCKKCFDFLCRRNFKNFFLFLVQSKIRVSTDCNVHFTDCSKEFNSTNKSSHQSFRILLMLQSVNCTWQSANYLGSDWHDFCSSENELKRVFFFPRGDLKSAVSTNQRATAKELVLKLACLLCCFLFLLPGELWQPNFFFLKKNFCQKSKKKPKKKISS